jgi:hypothetical protein
MSSEFDELQQQLAQATARDVGDGCHLDGHTEQLRDSWLAFGQLLEAADRDCPAVAVDLPRPLRVEGLRWAAMVAVAASVALVIGVAWNLSQDTTRSLGGSPTAVAVRVESSPSSAALEPGAVAAESPTLDPELAWDDSLDDRLQAASLALWQAHGTSRWHDLRWNSIQDTVQQMDEEFSADTL